jgi:hypothetical protein
LADIIIALSIQGQWGEVGKGGTRSELAGRDVNLIVPAAKRAKEVVTICCRELGEEGYINAWGLVSTVEFDTHAADALTVVIDTVVIVVESPVSMGVNGAGFRSRPSP